MTILQKLSSVASISSLFVTAASVLAKPNTDRIPATNTRSERTVTIPKQAAQIADDVFSLGAAIDPATGKIVEGFNDYHNRRDQAKGRGKSKREVGERPAMPSWPAVRAGRPPRIMQLTLTIATGCPLPS